MTNMYIHCIGIIPRAMAALFQELYSDPTSPSSSSSRASSPLSSSTTPKISKRHSSSAVNSNSNLKAPSRLMRPSSMLTPPSNLSRRASFSVEQQQQQRQQPANRRFSVKVSFVEIYNEDLVDLLNPAPADERPPVTIREDTKGQIYWTGVKEVPVDSTEDVLR